MTHRMRETLGFLRRKRGNITARQLIKVTTTAVTLLAFCHNTILQSAVPPVGTEITNRATATYTDFNGNPRDTQSNDAKTIVQQVAAMDLQEDRSKPAAPGQTLYFSHVVINQGNGPDTFSLTATNRSGDNFEFSNIALFEDNNQDGIPDDENSPITASPTLAAGGSFSFVVRATVPGGALNGQTGQVGVRAVSQFNGAVTDANTDQANVSGNAVISFQKAINPNQGYSPSGPYTITLSYNNVGIGAASNLVVTDILSTNYSYVSGSALWSETGATPLTDTLGGDPAGGNGGINYVVATNAGVVTVTATITNVPAGQAGTLTFRVNVKSGVRPQFINNTATYQYHDGQSDQGPFTSNNAQVEVLRMAGVQVDNGVTISSAPQGATVVYTNRVTNTGNDSDRFDLSFSLGNFPAGSTYILYQSDGVTPLTSSGGNGSYPDVGPLEPGQYVDVVVKITLPPAVSGGGTYTAVLTGISFYDSNVTDTGSDSLTTIAASTVELANPAGGAGQGPEASPVTTIATDMNTTARFTLLVTNLSAVSDTYVFAASSSTNPFGNPLPAGWTVVFRNTNGVVIPDSGVLAPGANLTMYADVAVPDHTAPGTYHVYFRVRSSTTGAQDIKHDAVAVNTTRAIVIASSQNGQVTPGGTKDYLHTILNEGNVLEGNNSVSSIDLAVANSISNWNTTIFFDANTNGVLDATDPAITSLDDISGFAGLLPNTSIQIFLRVFAPLGAKAGDANASLVTATTSNGSYTTPVPAAVSVTDQTTVISTDLVLTKEQALDANCDGVPDTAFTQNNINAGAVPGACIIYRLTVQNSGNQPASAVVVNDITPIYTTYVAGSASMTPAGNGVTITQPSTTAGRDADLSFDVGNMGSGDTTLMYFRVKINDN